MVNGISQQCVYEEDRRKKLFPYPLRQYWTCYEETVIWSNQMLNIGDKELTNESYHINHSDQNMNFKVKCRTFFFGNLPFCRHEKFMCLLIPMRKNDNVQCFGPSKNEVRGAQLHVG